MSEPVYRFKSGSRFSGDAAVVVAELERIRSEHGALRSEVILAEATAEESPLHGHFPWDDAEAAHQHRLEIARRLPRSIEIVRDDLPPVSMYVHVAEERQATGTYEPLAVIYDRPDQYLQALSEARRDLASAKRRLDELLDVARARGSRKGEIARIMLAVQALETANEAIHALH